METGRAFSVSYSRPSRPISQSRKGTLTRRGRGERKQKQRWSFLQNVIDEAKKRRCQVSDGLMGKRQDVVFGTYWILPKQ